jgi:RNA polymerase sigma-70 factor, ECF subfamily
MDSMNTSSSPEKINVKLLAAAVPDEVLVAAAKLGDRSAFVELWRRHSKTPFKAAYRITRNRADAEDVAQDAWMQAYVHLKDFDGRAAFSTWLTRIAINSALMMLRRKRSHSETSMDVTDGGTRPHLEFADQTNDVEQHFITHEDRERLRQAIRRLKPTLRIVVEIHQSNDSSIKEIADRAGISITATKSRLSRARTLLRRTLG